MIVSRLARHLVAPEPGWTHTTDVVVVGSGIAGLSVALHARAAGHAVTVVTKVAVADGSTRWARAGSRPRSTRPTRRPSTWPTRSPPGWGSATWPPYGCWSGRVRPGCAS